MSMLAEHLRNLALAVASHVKGSHLVVVHERLQQLCIAADSLCSKFLIGSRHKIAVTAA